MSILVDFRCENCREMQYDVVVEGDATVMCPQCEHVVDVGVYVGNLTADELMAERDPAVPFRESIPKGLKDYRGGSR